MKFDVDKKSIFTQNFLQHPPNSPIIIIELSTVTHSDDFCQGEMRLE